VQSHIKYIFRMIVLLEEMETIIRTMGQDGTYDGSTLQYAID
jgi:hypothetical protein